MHTPFELMYGRYSVRQLWQFYLHACTIIVCVPNKHKGYGGGGGGGGGGQNLLAECVPQDKIC